VSNPISSLSYLIFALQLSLGIVFLLSVLPKLRHPRTFAQNVVEYKILSTELAYWFGLVLIPLEIFLALAFLTGWLADIALPLAIVMLVVFHVAVGLNLRRGRQIACGCFGDASEQISPRTQVRLFLLLMISLLLLLSRNIGYVWLYTLDAIAANISILRDLLLTIFLATFLILLANWLLSLPELLFFVRHLRPNLTSTSSIQDEGKRKGI
jgi:hypothetical protein